jgi:hypothetical protein
MLASLRVRALHVIAAFAVSTAIVVAFLAFGAAQTSGTPVNAGVPLAAPLQDPIPAYASYIGWGQVSGASSGYYATLRAVPVTAWYWNGSAWSQRSRYSGQRVYIYPYASGWSWTWSQDQGWLAMRTSQLTIGYRPIAIAT